MNDDARSSRLFRRARVIDVSPVHTLETAPALPRPPETMYARSGDVNIAYQVIGDAPLDLVFVMGWVSHLEYFWREPSFARFLLRLASFSRLILFDKRGTGLSDRVPINQLPTLEQRMDDVRAVMDAVGSERAALCGVSEGGPMCSLFAATYPEKTLALVMIGTYAKRIRDEEYPWGPTAGTARTVLRSDARTVGWAGRHRRTRAERCGRSGVSRLVGHVPAHGRESGRGRGADADERRDRRAKGVAVDSCAVAGHSSHAKISV